MAPHDAGDANVLPELWETVADVDRFMCQQGQYIQSVLDDTIETITICSPSCTTFDDTPSMSVMGIFTRAKEPRHEELPEKPGLSALSKDQVMCRRRLDTETEQAMFVPEQGLTGSDFYHVQVLTEGDNEDSSDDVNVLTEGEGDDEDSSDEDSDEESEEPEEPRIYEERAILFQAVEHYEKLRSEPTLAKYFESEDDDVSITFHDDILKNPRFGEQIMLQGMQASQISIGDIFEVQGGLSPLKVEIASPRLCCAYVDKRNGSAFGLAGVKRHCNTYGLGGIFARVLVAGVLRDDMRLVRTLHPHPKWTMEYVSMTLYGEGPRKYQLKRHAYWSRDIKELKELCELEAFGRYEWKDEAKYILKYWDEYHPEDKKDASLILWSMNDFVRPFVSGLRFNSFFGSTSIRQSLQQYYTSTIEKLDILTDFLVDRA